MSMVVLRLVATMIGVTDSASADNRPANGPNVRRTRW
jgi:hypothetical protein